MAPSPPPTSSPDAAQPIAWTPDEQAHIDDLITRYPTPRSAILPVMWMAQRKWGWLSLDVMRLVGKTLGLPPSEVFAVASFYTMLKKQPTGQYLIQVCHTLSCQLVGAERVIQHISDKLGIQPGETTADGMFTLMRVECLASCGSAPMMQIDDDFHEQLTSERIDQILDGLAAGAPLPVPRPEVDQWTFQSLES